MYNVSIVLLSKYKSKYVFLGRTVYGKDKKKCCLQVYKFSNSQSKSVILHRVYFHCRSLKTKYKTKSCQFNNHKS